ncbi:DUF2808 domain-containing protein [Oscillatoria sp. CS-180]|uniref:DUF2808 domain-containing protein n=1 Tax=Oscillatoria sp. CS-180 TaxID=3021720 RepID=UPI00232CE561|nr:DUF2808 domain-containing protein [Oscillatoria sp. CS-180]MDB9525964.1 DUF2808 domain-containing protein [Oscillatoria sp. CS-180]
MDSILGVVRRSRLTLVVISALVVSAMGPQLSHLTAAQLGDGTTVFTSPPRLVSFVTTDDTANKKDVTYYVTVNLLPEAEESLETLTVELVEGRFTRLDYHADRIEVFEGTRQTREDNYPIESANYDEDSQTVTVRLSQSVAPGQVITLALKPVRNPSREGVYLFRVSAAPAGENPVAQRVGTGRIHIYRESILDIF